MVKRDDINDLRNVFADYYGVLATPNQVAGLLNANDGLAHAIQECGAYDTCCREAAIEALGKHLGLRGRWPLGADTEDYAMAYFMTFKHTALAAGFKLTPDFVESKS
jgi:hypothetical protein